MATMAGSKLGTVNKKRQGQYRRKRVLYDGLSWTGDAPRTVSPRLSRKTQRGIVFPEINPKSHRHSKTNTYLNNGFTSVGVQRFMSPHKYRGGTTAISSSIYSGKGKGSSGLPELNRTVGYGTTSDLAGGTRGAASYVLLGDYPEGRAARDIHIHLHPGRELRHVVDRRLKDISIVYNKPPPKLPILNQLSLQTHRLRYMANADYEFFGDKDRKLLRKEVDTSPTISPCPRETIPEPSSPTMLPVLDEPGDRLRRPTVDVAIPLTQSNDDFVALAKKAILSPIIIERCAKKTMLFYEKHYPLLLEPPAKKPPSLGDLKLRRERIKQRSRLMDKYIDEMIDEDGDSITTELKSNTFNPTLWDWNEPL